MDQLWRLWHRTGHRWIEKCNMNVLTVIRERGLSWAGHVARLDYKEVCAKALEVSRTSVVEMATAPLERNGEGQMVLSAPTTIQNLQMGEHGVGRGLQVYWRCRWLCGISSSVHGLAPTCSRSWCWRQFAKFGKSPVLVANAGAKQRYIRCLVDPSASGMLVAHTLLMAWTGADWWWWR